MASIVTDATTPQPAIVFDWLLRLVRLTYGYALLIIPLLLIRQYVKYIDLFNRDTGNGRWWIRLLSTCFRTEPEKRNDVVIDSNDHNVSDETKVLPQEVSVDNDLLPLPVAFRRKRETLFTRLYGWLGLEQQANRRTLRQYYTMLLICFSGLQLFYVLWGVMQERIMTREYDKVMFQTSEYLVLCNRITSVLILFAAHCFTSLEINPLTNSRKAPLFEFSFSALSNILSSWCQYEALKYVTFPTQVVSKACKIIPVMVMGWFVQRRTYAKHEYFTAGLVSFGLSLFLLSDPQGVQHRHSQQLATNYTNLGGVSLITGYLLLDSFTSNWQDRMFLKYSLSPLQMMFGVTAWAVVLNGISLLQQNTLFESIRFSIEHPVFLRDVLVSSTCSGFGQIFIFLTISQFGAAMFVLIMTVRMGLSILLSCILFNHKFTLFGILGVFLVFFALFLRAHLSSRFGKGKA